MTEIRTVRDLIHSLITTLSEKEKDQPVVVMFESGTVTTINCISNQPAFGTVTIEVNSSNHPINTRPSGQAQNMRK